MTKQEIYDRLSVILQETFDIDPASIKPDARLSDDLDIDSIDAVDLLVKLKPIAGRSLQPEVFKAVRTLQDVVEAVYALLNTPGTSA
ncbi:acyl carrier protein [Chitinimonas sp.]|uniref:acyl carrier protein n=1 Tax=Chitinimonas sp. TaxID=1934313 RepID=UPI002F9311AE